MAAEGPRDEVPGLLLSGPHQQMVDGSSLKAFISRVLFIANMHVRCLKKYNGFEKTVGMNVGYFTDI